jgi:hypothetical protein
MAEPHKSAREVERDAPGAAEPRPGAILYDEGGPVAYLAEEVTISELIESLWEYVADGGRLRIVCEWRKLRWTTPEELADPDRLFELFGDYGMVGMDTSVVYTTVEDEEQDAHLYVRLETA